MTRFLKPLLFGLVVAGVAHIGVILALPNVIMSIAMQRIEARTSGANAIFHNPRVTAQNQSIVRSSPDLAYSTCVLDVSKGPVRIFVGKGADYASAAFYAANTDNVYTLNDRDIGPNGAYITVRTKQKVDAVEPGDKIVELPSGKGLLLVRRLAPSVADYARVEQERAQDFCKAG